MKIVTNADGTAGVGEIRSSFFFFFEITGCWGRLYRRRPWLHRGKGEGGGLLDLLLEKVASVEPRDGARGGEGLVCGYSLLTSKVLGDSGLTP